MDLKLIFLFPILQCLIETVLALRPLIIMTASGPVKGKLNRYKSMEYYSYLNIPFAENPIGCLRFMPPVPRKPWNEVLDATREGSVCVQEIGRYKKNQMSEDCLHINIYVPAKGAERPLPVAMVIHGGALNTLSGNSDYIYGPQLLLERGIIVIGINYRLGPLGFLSLNIQEASGNAALKDILLSLAWIKQNIRQFGGNPKNVTLVGHSSGAALAHYLMLTSKSKELFQQVILLSGSALSPRVLAKHPKLVSLALARELGLKTNNVYEILRYLREVDAHEMIAATQNLGKDDISVMRHFSPFVPSIEIESPHAVVTVDPVEFFRINKKLPVNIRIMAGNVEEEGISLAPLIYSKPFGMESLRMDPQNCIPTNIEYPLGSHRSKRLGRSIAELYFGKQMNKFTVTEVSNLASDSQYIYSIYYWVKRFKSLIENNPLYYYIFDYDGYLNWSKLFYNIHLPGTAHSDEVGYIFLTNVTKDMIDTADARSLQVVNTMLTLLSNFIFYGNPTPSYSPVQWPDYGTNQTYLLINDNPTVEHFCSCELKNRMAFWEKAYNEYYEYVEKGGPIEYKIYP